MGLCAVFFDFDGTLAHTERDGHRVAYNLAFADLGLPWEWDVDRYGELLAVAGGRERLEHFIATEDPPRPRGDARELAERIHARKAARFAELAGAVALRTGVRRLVAEAVAEGLTLALVTTARRDGVAAVLRHAPDLLAAFTLVVAGDEVAAKKPAPDAYLAALERSGLDARDCIAVEDSAIGLAAASAAGIATVVTINEYTAGERFEGARAVLTSLGDADEPARAVAGSEPANGLVTVGYLRALIG